MNVPSAPEIPPSCPSPDAGQGLTCPLPTRQQATRMFDRKISSREFLASLEGVRGEPPPAQVEFRPDAPRSTPPVASAFGKHLVPHESSAKIAGDDVTPGEADSDDAATSRAVLLR